MPNARMRRNSVVDMLSKVHVNRGSLLKGIENLLKTIESSENAVMIPTLLRDKCDFDAWELLFVAKILKASILGHSDLVEFYMNHMGNSTNGNSTNGTQTSNLNDPSSSPIASPNGITRTLTSPSLSSTSSVSSMSTTTGPQQQQQQQSVRSQQSSSVSWMTANQQTSNSTSISSGSFSNSLNESSQSSSASSSNSSSSSSISSSSSSAAGGNLLAGGQVSPQVPQPQPQQHEPAMLLANQSDSGLQEPAGPPRPQGQRQAQPPSLLQLTTTNNHINSVAAGLSSAGIEQLTSQLTALQTSSANNSNSNNSNHNSGAVSLNGALSISTAAANQQSANASASTNGNMPKTKGPPSQSNGNSNHNNNNNHHAELRTSRSAGCLFRINSSGASSPRTPAQTPTSTSYPQAETLAANGQSAASFLLASDPAAPAKLLLQIEQLKSSINHVTNLLESVVELYKKSIDNIA